MVEALELWGLAGAEYSFVAGRENQVYKVEHDGRCFAMRIRRPGYRKVSELQSEILWLLAMANAGLSVPKPVASTSGAYLENVAGKYVDLILWLDGVPLGATGQPLRLSDPQTTFQALGQQIAELHIACDDWDMPDTFDRCRWDAAGLLGQEPVWGKFWENPTLDSETSDLFSDFRARAARHLEEPYKLDFGLIHADLVRENVILDGKKICLIDFDDGGYGFRIFDLATTLVKLRGEPNYNQLKEALLSGYQDVRPLDTSQLDLFMALRAVTYVGWIVPRIHEIGSEERNTRFVNQARELCTRYMDRAHVV